MEDSKKSPEGRSNRSLAVGILAVGIVLVSIAIAAYAVRGHLRDSQSDGAGTQSNPQIARIEPPAQTTPASVPAPESTPAESEPLPNPEVGNDQETPDPMNCFAVHDFADKTNQTPETRQQFAAKTNAEAKARGIGVGTWGESSEHLAFITLRASEAQLRTTETRMSKPDMLAGLCVLGFAQVEFSVMDDRSYVETIGKVSTNAYDTATYLNGHPAQ